MPVGWLAQELTLFFDTFSICANLKIWHLERGTGIRTLVFWHSHLSFKYRHINKILRLHYIWSSGIGKTGCFSFSSYAYIIYTFGLYTCLYFCFTLVSSKMVKSNYAIMLFISWSADNFFAWRPFRKTIIPANKSVKVVIILCKSNFLNSRSNCHSPLIFSTALTN